MTCRNKLGLSERQEQFINYLKDRQGISRQDAINGFAREVNTPPTAAGKVIGTLMRQGYVVYQDGLWLT